MGSLYRSKHELVFVYRVGNAPHFNAVELGRHGRNRTNVWDYASVNSLPGSRREDLALHPTVKPTALVADALQDVTRQRRAGARHLSRIGNDADRGRAHRPPFRGLEIDPAYVDVAIDRWERPSPARSRSWCPSHQRARPRHNSRRRHGSPEGPFRQSQGPAEASRRPHVIGVRYHLRQDTDGHGMARGKRELTHRRGPATADLSGRAQGQPDGGPPGSQDDREARGGAGERCACQAAARSDDGRV